MIETQEQNFDIVIAGAGLVGAALGAAVARDPLLRGLRVALLEPGPAPQTFAGEQFDPRVVALTRQSEAFLKSLEIWDAVALRACPYQNMVVWDGEGTAEIQFSAGELHQDNLGHIAENGAVLQALLGVIEQSANVSVLRGVGLESVENRSANTLQLHISNHQILQTTLLIAADGANSKARTLFDIPVREWHYGHTAIVTTVRATNSHQYTAWQRFMHTGPLALLPLPEIGGHSGYCSIVWSVEDAKAQHLLTLDDAEFCAALGAAFEHRLGLIETADRRFSFPLQQRHAKHYVEPGFALLGDAAHTIHPLAGQGVNLGLLDVQALLEEMRRAQRRHLPLSDFSILQRYQRQRLGHNLAVMGLMEGFKRLFGSRSPAAHVARNWGISRLNHLKLLKNFIAKQALGAA